MENLDRYEGQVLNGMLHGKGKLTNPKGVAEGTFVNGRLEGEATITLASGKKYLVHIKDGVLLEKTVLKDSLIDPRRRPFINPNEQPGVQPKPKGSVGIFGLDL